MKIYSVAFKICVVVALLSGSHTSHATLMRTTYTAQIDSLLTTAADSFWDVNDVFNFEIVYEDTSTISHHYTDGLNGIGEFGSGDDRLLQTLDFTGLPGYIFESDAQFTFGTALSAYAQTFADTTLSNLQRAQLTSAGPLRSSYLKDGFSFSVNFGAQGFGTISLIDADLASPIYPSEYVTQQLSFRISEETTAPVAPVPEPATMLLFGAGLVGLVGSRMRKKKK